MHTLQSRAGLTATLLAGLVLAAVPSATAAITFDAASRAATTSTGRTSLSWPHVDRRGRRPCARRRRGRRGRVHHRCQHHRRHVQRRSAHPGAELQAQRGRHGDHPDAALLPAEREPRRRRIPHHHRHDAGRGGRHLRGRRLAGGGEPGRATDGGDQRRHERRRLHLHQHHEPRGQLVDRGRGGKRQLRLLHRGRRPDRTRGHRGQRHDGRHEHQGADRGRRHHPGLGPQRRQPPRALAGVARARREARRRTPSR